MGKKLSESPRRQRKRAARKDAILQMALKLVIEGGLEGLTIHRLARELDYTPGALYRYFPSKGAVLAELQRHSIETIHESIREKLATVFAREKLQGISDKHMGLVRILVTALHHSELNKDHPHHLKLIIHLFGDPRLLIPAEELMRSAPAFMALLDEVDGYIAAAEKSKAFKPGPVRQRTLLLWSSAMGVMQLEKLTRIPAVAVNVQSLCRELVISLLLGWGATRSSISEALELIDD